jgi:ATP-binding cassette, subfamily B, bacterial MsbA
VSHIRLVFQFGWHYLRRYWVRLAAGVTFGVLFGMSNASFVWASKTLVERFVPESQTQASPSPTAVSAFKSGRTSALSQSAKQLSLKVDRIIDPWLPRLGTELDWRRLLGALLFLPLLVFLRSSMDYLSSYCMGWVSERVINDLRLDVLEKLSTLSLNFFTRTTTGDLLTRINSDTSRLLRCLKQGAADLIKEPISLVSVLIAILLIDWKLTLFAMLVVPLCFFPLFVLGRKARRASKAGLKAEILQASQFVELLGSIRIVKAYHLEQEQIQRYRNLSKQLVRHGMKGLQAKELANPVIEIISMLGIGGLIIYIFKTHTTVNDFVGFLTGLMFFFMPIKKLAGVHILFEQASVGVQRLAEILREQPSVKEPAQPQPLTQFQYQIRFNNVSFAYEPNRPVLRNFSLAIPRGIRIGVAGPSGSGKSTLVNLLFRFYDPTVGTIAIDGIDLREVTFRDLRQLLALVSQEVIVFDQTVAENIALGKTGATRAEVEAAARDAYAHDFILQLPQGYETRLGERGVTLSGGQRQRIAIARAFVRNAPILVLDEATASLDSEAEAEVQRAIEHLSENRTVISVAHRLSTLASCDEIIVLSEGRIIEHGGLHELLERDGIFAAMARRQGLLAAAGRFA